MTLINCRRFARWPKSPLSQHHLRSQLAAVFSRNLLNSRCTFHTVTTRQKDTVTPALLFINLTPFEKSASCWCEHRFFIIIHIIKGSRQWMELQVLWICLSVAFYEKNSLDLIRINVYYFLCARTFIYYKHVILSSVLELQRGGLKFCTAFSSIWGLAAWNTSKHC